VILEEIVARSRADVEERRRRRPLRELERAIGQGPAPCGLVRALAAAPGGIGLLAELKKASPSAGVLRAEFDVPALAGAYARGGADALSVVTEVPHFQGALDHLERAAEAGLPRLQKDFLLDEYQVLEGRAAGADAVLLIAEALAPERRWDLCRLALDLDLDVLFEAHAPEEARRVAELAERAPERILVGINNRDLRTFAVALDTSLRLLRQLPPGLHVVSESGIGAPDDVVRLRDAGAFAVLVGEALVRAADPEAAARALMASVRPHGVGA
jgi:indole-3-glycerol phosphate synthase